MNTVPLFSVIVPTIGRREIVDLLSALERQTIDREAFEIIIVTDGCVLDDASLHQAANLGANVVAAPDRRGPGAARNLGAACATGTWLAFTEDDVTPSNNWLESASANATETVDVIEGGTYLPDGTPARRQKNASYIPTNLFVRAHIFVRASGYCELFFNDRSKAYFREDSDFGFALEKLSARTILCDDVRVEHPFEHPNANDVLRWARRYEMDPILQRRHPAKFRDNIEVVSALGITIRRPFVRLCQAFVLSVFGVTASKLSGHNLAARVFLSVATVSGLGLWAKWRFKLRRLPLVPVVPFVLVSSLGRGQLRARRIAARP
jgi:glycosyltransferase involved in cell wall biosynthesis